MIYSRIYYKDRFTNKIWFYQTIWPRVSYDYLEQYMKSNNKIFLYVTKIEWQKKQKTKHDHELISKQMQWKD